MNFSALWQAHTSNVISMNFSGHVSVFELPEHPSQPKLSSQMSWHCLPLMFSFMVLNSVISQNTRKIFNSGILSVHFLMTRAAWNDWQDRVMYSPSTTAETTIYTEERTLQKPRHPYKEQFFLTVLDPGQDGLEVIERVGQVILKGGGLSSLSNCQGMLVPARCLPRHPYSIFPGSNPDRRKWRSK